MKCDALFHELFLRCIEKELNSASAVNEGYVRRVTSQCLDFEIAPTGTGVLRQRGFVSQI
ncbi:hypothetical protein ACFTS5_09600 [Nocardia sp. NPDC056952]|uniref:hypothetical protein n=1 Tax=Nocardia sp. NPDC056952 TaxID=3345979 RepID=UPI00362AD403